MQVDTLHPALAGALAARGYETLTPVQQAMLNPDAAGRDLLVSAQTGSGKTVAFGIAVAPTLLRDVMTFEPASLPMGLVIAPTRELALQVSRELGWLYEQANVRIATCVGGMEMRKERRALEQGAHIVVGTPGRLRDHITRRSLDMSVLRAVVLDEADEMLDLGFREDLEFILAAAPETRRTLMFSATVPKPIAHLARKFQHDALRVSANSDREQHIDIEYQVTVVAPGDRENAIINTLLFHDSENAIVFCATREAVKHLASRLLNRGFSVVALSGELSQAERTNALQSMRDGRARVCVATDVAARGIDLPNLDLVIHADLPNNAETLLHRSGRTGRAGRKGVSALVVPQHRRGVAARLMSAAKLDSKPVAAPTIAEVDQRNRQRILQNPALSCVVADDERTLVDELLAAHSPTQIAAAYLRRELGALPAAEELNEAIPAVSLGKRRERTDGEAERTPREKRVFEGGVWFTISVGRKQRAEPRWLLPLICKAGQITKHAVGSIRILDTETRFEIAQHKADGFWAAIQQNGTGEKGVNISRAEGGPAPEAGARQGWEPGKKDRFKPNRGPKPEGAARHGKPFKKPRWKKDKAPG